jgi:hydroxyethylthiazole kinase
MMTPDDIADRLEALRAAAPLVHCVTNYVAMQVTANALLAIGASPAMVHAVEEVAEFATLAGATTLNIGTLSGPWLTGMLLSAAAARAAGRPWVFDPVAAGATSFRREASARLLAERPTIIRGNASEVLALAGLSGRAKGVDAGDAVEVAAAAARGLAAAGAVVAVTGPIDLVTDGARVARIANGHALMPRVTALGCALTGVVGAFAAIERDAFAATAAALTVYAVAGEMAGEVARGPGSFAVAFLDALASIGRAEIRARARLEIS